MNEIVNNTIIINIVISTYLSTFEICHSQLMVMEFHQLVLVVHVLQLRNKKRDLFFYVHIVSIVLLTLPTFPDHLLPIKKQK